MKGLREQVETFDSVDSIVARRETGQISRQRLRVARDVKNGFGRPFDQVLHHVIACAGARRIEDDEVEGRRRNGAHRPHPSGDRRAYALHVGQPRLPDVPFAESGSGGARLHGDNLPELERERKSEKAGAGEQIQSGRKSCFARKLADLFHHWAEKKVIRLEKRRGRDVVSECAYPAGQ